MPAAAVSAAAVLLALPTGAAAATTCELNGAVLDVTMPASGDEARLGVDQIGGTEILVLENGQVDCTGSTPTVNNTDAISVHNAPGGTDNDVRVLEASRFAPGPTDEPGDNEIEIFVNLNNGAGSELGVDTHFAGGSIVFGTGGINTNATVSEVDPDADIILTDTPLLSGFGNPGPDFISARGGAGTGGPLPGPILLSGGDGNDILSGGEGADTIDGGGGSDQLPGNGGGDTIDGGPGGNVFLSGGEGNDRLVPSSINDQVTGDAGTDEVDYSVHLTTGLSFDLDGSSTEIENVIGTNFADVLRGDSGPNVLLGLQGNDVLEGRGGDDALGAGPGDDSLDVRDGGPDTADCGTETDTVTADAAGIDSLTGCEDVLFPVTAPAPDPGSGTGPTAPPAPEPSNEFRFGKVQKNKEKGTARLTVIVPGPGEIDLARTKKVKPQEKRAEGEGEVKLAIKPSRRSKQRLREKGEARVRAGVTYTPDGGDANTQSKTVKLVKK